MNYRSPKPASGVLLINNSLKKKIVALLGNPNSGKSSLFNQLTGLRQKTGNFPGVTVDKKSGSFTIGGQNEKEEVTLVDLPGIYSIYPKSEDEKIVMDILAHSAHPDYPDAIIVVVDASNLQRNLLLFTEIADLNLPVILALNMLDIASGMKMDVSAVQLARLLNVPVVNINARTGEGLEHLRTAVHNTIYQPQKTFSYFLDPAETVPALIDDVRQTYNLPNNYLALQYVCQHDNFSFLDTAKREKLDELIVKHDFDQHKFQSEETITRYDRLSPVIQKAIKLNADKTQPHQWTQRLDQILLHPFWGYVLFMLVLLVIFQAIFSWASYPADLIDEATAASIEWVKNTLPQGLLNDLITQGIMAGIGGVIIFIPQIAFLFLLVGLLEESGYMARVMVIMDKLMRKFNLNGRSVVPLISGVACAVPAIMATRSINNRYERLLTILVTPLMACSARLPIYTILIALVVPETKVLGILNVQGLLLLGLYLLGVVGAVFSAWLISLFIKRKERSYFVLEMPTYKMPRWNNVAIMVYDSVKTFVVEAGKVIVAITIILWVLASYGPGENMEKAEEKVKTEMVNATPEEQEAAVASARLENSYAGTFGRAIEPAIKPLGYDWKIGIALIASFAAREVFVGTMATIYSLGAEASEDEMTVKEKLRSEKNPVTGQPVYTTAVAVSLMLFYAFAMMCMSTLATVYRETHGWKWPMIQLAYTMVLAYVSAFIAYQLLS